MKKFLLFLVSVILFSIAFVSLTIYLIKPVSSDESYENFLITKGSSASKIGNDLYKAGLIKSPFVFKIYVQLTGKQKKIQAGEFRLSPSYSLLQIVDTFQKGPLEVWITVPEGLRREEIAWKFSNALDKDESFVEEFVRLSDQYEGYLFPDTYLFPKSASASAIINRMNAVFDLKTESKTITKQQLIMASIIERETKGNEEKPMVAGVLYKRLSAGWPLQVDATIQYALGSKRCSVLDSSCKWWEPIYSLDKEIDSPFNTYKNAGLPPSPIGNPGIESINAAVSPVESDNWYYLHDGSGKIHFARTLEEHNQNIQKYIN